MLEYAEEVRATLASIDSEPTEAQLRDLRRVFSQGNYDELDRTLYPQLFERVKSGMDAGALGIGMAHQYYPGANGDEIYRVFEYAGRKQLHHLYSRSVDGNRCDSRSRSQCRLDRRSSAHCPPQQL